MINVKRGLPLTIPAFLGVLHLAVTSGNTINVKNITNNIFNATEGPKDPYYSLIKENSDGTVYLGSSGYVYRVNLQTFAQIWSQNITKKVEDQLITCEASTPDDQEMYWCENQISVIEEIESQNQLLVCGTNARQPRCWNCSMPNGFDQPPSSCAIYTTGKIERYFPNRPDFDSTWLYESDTGLVYVGTEREASKDSYFAKASLDDFFTQSPQSLLTNNVANENWLNMPAFVGKPMKRGDYIYFFFRETATEYKNAGKIIYSRVGRICADNSERASGSGLSGFYFTLVKARLNCSIDLDFPFYFNEIQDVYYSKDNITIYAVFTTPREGPPASAVCAFSWLEIEDLFDNAARYKGQETSDSDWLYKRYTDLEGVTQRPGTCDVPFDSSFTPDSVNKYNLINQLVPSIRNVRSRSSNSGRDSDSPILYCNNYRFTSIVEVEEDNPSGEIILMIGTNDMKILKAHFKHSMLPEEYGSIVSEIELGNGKHEVRDMITYTEEEKTYVIATAVTNAFKIPVVYCHIYTTCDECVNAADPNCVWKDRMCIEKTNNTQEHDPCYITSDSEDVDIMQAISDVQHLSRKNPHFVNFYALAIAKKGCNFVYNLTGNDNNYWSVEVDEGTATEAEFFAIRLTGRNKKDANNATLYLSCNDNKESTVNMPLQVKLDDSELAECPDDIYNYDCELARYEYELTEIRQKILGKCYDGSVEVYQCPSFALQDINVY